ncbi:hypothetical protein CKM354_001292600 [Cercospora kikuchii]|uniref:Heterokaryon incompatibility domain-containing protein n=1 Tax=Cercospora kikuchii TaxID=84275 RepID=A0A9P3FN31_9PEZI|nr:uncharacterized protein CKM354_001292600 [Cercospora kikuchii]GIZ49909.1 hypothetical protein CKM354_001292600 [Cercospora kikuchii]
MWLIDVETRELEYFASCEKVRYAILSHTWEEEEVTFQEFRDGTAKDRMGYAKIMKTCNQAQKDGLRYAWVDTCCINKESSAELSEAINSMWRYYWNARICYALLSDVRSFGMEMTDDMLIPNRESFPVNEKAQALWNGHVVKSRWFTRGWTLQELIAPQNLLLFNSAWTLLGERYNLCISLSELTGIDAELLAYPGTTSLTDYTIAKKMSWAARRETSRIEDRAYSLLGLFDINMPLLYGEGRKAFIRLQEEIIKSSSDMSFLAFGPQVGNRNIDGIFADSPDRFAPYANVVPWKGRLESAEFRLTNRGLQFHGLCTVRGFGEVLGLLNCRLKDDFRGPLALRLCPRDELDQRHVPSAQNSTQDYVPEPCRPARLLRLITRLETTHVNDRIAVVPNIENVEIHEGPATILRSPRLATNGYDRPYSAKGLWVRSTKNSKLTIKIVNAVPQGAWNHETGFMLMKYRLLRSTTEGSKQYVAGVTVKLAGETSHLIDIGFRFGDSSILREHEFKVARHVPNRDMCDWAEQDSDYLRDWKKNTDSDTEDHQECLSHCQRLCEGLELVVKLRYKRVHGEMIWVLAVGAYDQNNKTDASDSRKDLYPSQTVSCGCPICDRVRD